jgi:plasmid maintenance system killer protein
MEVYFATKKLAETLSDEKKRVRVYGTSVAKKINMRLTQMAATDTLEGLHNQAGRCHELREDRAGQLAMDLTDNLRIIFRPRHDPPPTSNNGGLDWSSVTEILVLEVTDYHGS